MEEKEALFGKNLDELKQISLDLGLPKFLATQLSDWLYKKEITSIDEMSNLSKKTKELLNEKYIFGTDKPVDVIVSKDGTKKYLYKCQNDKYIEAAYIPSENRKTLCISSQIGCKMGCEFCMTGRQKFNGNLTARTIVNQLRSLPEYKEITNIVYMGMGEPMDNYDAVMRSLEIMTSDWGMAMSPRRITVSTIGKIPEMKNFILNSQAHLAISIHSPFDKEREEIMPIQKTYPISEIISELRNYNWYGQRRLSFEYIVFDNFNHSEKHVDELAKILNGLNCRINLIRFHKIPDSKLNSSNENNLLIFQEKLKEKGLSVTIRTSRGQDIDAACGLLSTKKISKNQS